MSSRKRRYTDFEFMLRGSTWSVEFVTFEDLDGCYGECVSETLTIRIAKDACHTQVLSTFWHELIHAMLSLLPDGKTKDEEVIAGLMEAGMIELLGQKSVLPRWVFSAAL